MNLRLILTAALLLSLAGSPSYGQEDLTEECIEAGYTSLDECYGAPIYEEPAEEDPVYAEPMYEEPVYEEPAYEEPLYEEPEQEDYQAPDDDEPVYEAPEEEEPLYEDPAQDEQDEAVLVPGDDEEIYDDEQAADDVIEDEAVEQDDAAIEDEAVTDDQQVVEDEQAVEEELAVQPEDDATDHATIDAEDVDGTGLIDESVEDEPYVEEIEDNNPLEDLPPENLWDAREPLAEGMLEDEAAPLLDSAKDGEYATEADGEDTVMPEDDESAQVTSPLSAAAIVAAAPPETNVLAAAPEVVTPQNITIINTVENTYIYQVNNQTIINNYNEDRYRVFGGDDHYWFDQIGPNQFRESVYRADGSTVVTTRDRYGNILERYVVNADGSSYVLAYFDPDYYDDLQYWGDPGYYLPALRLTISLGDYVLDWRYANADAIAIFLGHPPVETARRVYSIDEVKRSARLRDSVRRLEVTDLSFASGSSELSRNQVRSLERLADAINTLLDENPGETFLIEGHTDAVGSDQSNLLLSDKRASTVARILTRFYGVPPENLATQGYGKRYLRINTPYAEPQNRRVTVRRITPLVQPYFASR
ncbi:OmpA family protein [Devosia epidermidihirudinis]|uniref:OmpA family protein n=1 Tax=Devosia epidermidihirudinis TaxID=1293439 RepID=UPI00069717E4|nr:OmpA family protein [Devosia epidermidihirudinis]